MFYFASFRQSMFHRMTESPKKLRLSLAVQYSSLFYTGRGERHNHRPEADEQMREGRHMWRHFTIQQGGERQR